MSNRNGTGAAAAAVEYGRLASSFADALKAWNSDPSEDNRQRLEQLRARIDGELTKHADNVPEVDKDKLAGLLADETKRAGTLQAMAAQISDYLKAPGQLREDVEIIDDWDAIDAQDREWLIPAWLPAGRIGMFSGKGGKGKTWMMLQMATAMASGGGEWLGRPSQAKSGPMAIKSGVVVFSSWEDEPAEFKRRLEMMDKAERSSAEAPQPLFERIRDPKKGKSRFIFLDMARRGPVWGVPERTLYNQRAELLPAGKIVRKLCEQRGARLLILDSLGFAYGPDDSGNEGVAQFLADWDAWGRDNKCAVLLIHHPAKHTGKGEPSYRGASSWDAHARFRWELGDVEDGDSKLTGRIGNEKSSYAMKPDPVYLERSQKSGWAWKVSQNEGPIKTAGTEAAAPKKENSTGKTRRIRTDGKPT